MTSAMFERRRVRVGELDLAVHSAGTGPTALLLHGFTGSGTGFEGISRPLVARFRVVAPDLVGHGESPAPTDESAYGMEACIEQVAAIIDTLSLGRVHLFGYSMGGRAALALAVRHPEKLASLALLGASAGLGDADERAARRASDEALAERIERDGVEAFVKEWEGIPLFATQSQRLSDAGWEAQRRGRLANSARGLAGSLRGMGTGAQPPLHHALSALSLPVWVGAGADDPKFRAIARKLGDLIPSAECATVPDAGHAAHLENPAFVASALRDFWTRASAQGDPETRP